MKEQKLYVCEYCNTSYKNKTMAIQCEETHKKLTGASFEAAYKPFTVIPSGEPLKIRVKFQGSDKWIDYKR